MTDKTWPIAVDPTCQAKWSWSTIYMTNSASASCHRTKQYQFDLDTFDDFHNLPGKQADRQKMLDGEWPGNGCQYCKKIEDAGGYSDRHFQNTLPNYTPEAVTRDLTTTTAVPRLVEVYFDNACDLKCMYCGPWYSSAWEGEFNKFGPIKTPYWVMPFNEATGSAVYSKSPNRREYVEKFWSWWDKHYQEVNYFQFLGGEPFVQAEFDECLDFISDRANPNLSFNIVTNLNCSTERLKSKIEQFKQLIYDERIAKLQIVASIDCWEEQQEFIRYPLSLARWEANFEYLVKQPWITLSINSAVSSLSIKHMAPLLRKLNAWRVTAKGKHRAIYQNFMTIQDPIPLNPDYLGAGVFTKDFEEILSVMQESVKLDTWYERLIPVMEGIRTQIEASQPNVAKLRGFHDYLNELDRRRGTDWKPLFPWLVDEFNRHSAGVYIDPDALARKEANWKNSTNHPAKRIIVLLYDVLGIDTMSTPKEMTRAYKHLMEHPMDDAHRQRIQEAYDTLVDPVKRAKYDQDFTNNPDTFR